ncbi:MAG: hypothetical protein KIT33_12600 [Candidatus Kapabacteria bacterium]|nr:hypothetical protein [Ignavibacteriota bacterium]MCW5885800.1 hypothetical protein [Candidatus Kapabacteria bacterium]
MYAFIFYGTYRALNSTILSKGKEKQEDRRISAVAQTSTIIGLHILTILFFLHNRLNINIILLEQSNFKIFVISLVAILWIFCHLRYVNRLKQLSEKYKPIFDKYKYLDRIVGFGSFIISVILCILFLGIL